MTEILTVKKVPSLAHGGAFSAHVSEGRLLRITPFVEDKHPNETIQAWVEMVYAENRVRRPAIRRGWLDTIAVGKPHRGKGRGDDAFVEVTWDEALSLVSTELERVRKDHGNKAIFGGSYGWSSAGRLHHARTLVHRFLASIGGCTGQVTNYSYGAAMRLLPHVVGSIEAVAGPITDWPSILANCEHFVAFGGIAAKNWKIQSGGAGYHLFDDFMRKAHERDIRFTNVSPSRSDIDPLIDAEWLPIRPGTDVALILAAAYVVQHRGKADTNFLESHCVGYNRFFGYLLGKDDGIAKTPEWAAPITGIPVDAIVAFADSLIDKRVMLSASWSLQRAQHGEQPYWAVVSLAAMLGQIGAPGCGFAFGYGSMNGMGNPRYALPVPGPQALKGAGDVQIPVARMADLLLSPGQTVEFDGQTITYPDIRLVYWAGGNPFHHHQDLFRLKRAFQQPDTVIVHEPWWTATARHADIVLPATTPLERNDIGGSSRDPFLFAMHKAIEPQFEARDDFAIFSELADRLGGGQAFHEDKSEDEWLRELYARFRTTMKGRGFAAPEFDAFWSDGYVRIPEPERDYTILQRFREDPASEPLKTPSGKIELFSEAVASFRYSEAPGLPVWREPSEWLGSPTASRYPLHMISPQPQEKLHGQMDGALASRRIKIKGRNPLTMNPVDAAKRGLSDGDVVVVFNDRGSCLAGLRVSDDIMAGVVSLPTGATFDPIVDPEEGIIDNHGNPNALTQDIGTSRLGQGCSAQSCLVDVRLCKGQPRPVGVFGQPRFEAR